MKSILLVLTVFLSSVCFAGGSISGSGESYFQAFSINKNLNIGAVSAEPAKQVYYMRQKQAEIQFATNTPGDNKVEIQSLRPEEISNPAVMEGLKRSQQSRQWENVKVPSEADLSRNIKNMDRIIQNMGFRQ